MPSERKRPRLEGPGTNEVPDVEAVLDDDLLRPVPLVDCYAGVVAHPKSISRLIRAINDVHPVPTLQHLKRVRKKGPGFELLLAPAAEFPSGEACLSALADRGLDVEGLTAEVRVVAVPSAGPRTRAQFKPANEAWSCNFHEDPGLERLLAGAMFSPEELNRHRRWLSKAQDAAVGLDTPSAVVVDPARDAAVAVAKDSRGSNPLRHAVMNVVDLVARSQLGGAWDALPGDFFDGDLPDRPPPVGTVRNRDEADGDKPVGPYLCTGYDVYLSREPCTMCAMALVHSRVKRVFYAAPTSQGILGSRAKLHSVRALNHHYQVFRRASSSGQKD